MGEIKGGADVAKRSASPFLRLVALESREARRSLRLPELSAVGYSTGLTARRLAVDQLEREAFQIFREAHREPTVEAVADEVVEELRAPTG